MYGALGSSAPFILSVLCLLRSMALAYSELKPNLRGYWFVSFTGLFYLVCGTDLSPVSSIVVLNGSLSSS
ncbi:hypothetical protein Bca4012_072339 [Brassica carinata]|uniref:Secreted protein n=1 Tax=Brassica carinata TaxID=52824 RepID=A0A8X7QI42_BRACI|nr:hypothetical protein Bca52824_064743 [Brassica carinata]